MTITTGPNLGLAVNGVAGEAHYAELMKQWRGLDALVQPVAIDKDLAAPPGSPVNGDVYIVGGSPTGAWSGKTRQIARFTSVTPGWEFYPPRKGWEIYVQDENKPYRYDGSSWVDAGSGASTSGVLVAAQSAVASSVTGVTTETTLATVALPVLGINDAIRVTLLFSFPTSSNTKTFKAKLGATTVLNLSSTTTTSANLQFVIRNRGAANSQITQASNKPNFGDTAAAITLSTIDTSVSQTLLITGTLASASETLVLEGYTVEILKA